MKAKTPKVLTRAVLASAVVALAAALPLLSGVTPASAATTGAVPAWDPDVPNSGAPYGNIVFYDSNGNQITGGTDLNNPFAYAVATTGANFGANQATVNFYNPQPGTATGNWTGTSEAGSTVFSPSSSLPAGTPANIVAYAPTDPVVQASPDITTWLSGNIPSTTMGYAHTIQVRLSDSGPRGAGSGTHYWETDIGYNTSASPVTITEPAPGTGSIIIPANSWIQIFPVVTSSSVSLSSTLVSPQKSGTDIPLKATVTPSTAAGTVQFFDGSTALGSPVTVASGSASFTDSRPPGVGSHAYTAVFTPTLGDETGLNSSSATIVGQSPSSNTLTMVIAAAQQPTTTTVASSAATGSVFGQPVTYTATVSSGTTVNGGTVSFTDNGSPITCTSGNQTVASGTATCTYTPASVGAHTIVASYSGNTSFEASDNTAQDFAQTVTQDGSTTTLKSTPPSPVGVNQSVTLTATVAAQAPGSGTPTGTVEFKNGSSDITGCSADTMTDGVASCSTTFSSGGTDSLTAVYSGDTNFTTSTGNLSEQVLPATDTTVSSSESSPPGSVFGQSVTYTATVAPSTGTGVPTGSVQFMDGSTVISGCSAAGLTGGTNSATATCTTTPATVGTHAIKATYSGSASFGGSIGSLSQTVGQASTTTTITPSTNPSVTGAQVTFTATVSVTSPGAGTPTGSVEFENVSGASPTALSGCSARTISSGKATCAASFEASASPVDVMAVYSGDTNFTTSPSSQLAQTINPAGTSTGVTASRNPALTNTEVTYTAAITVTQPGAGTPTGTVQFDDAGAPITNCVAQTVAGGKATCDPTYPSPGSHSITAVYSGDTNFLTSTSSALTEKVIAAVAPSPPLDLTATAGQRQVTLKWNPPTSNGGSPVLGYDVYVGTKPGGESATPVNRALLTSDSDTVTGLTNGVKYYFVVKADNAVGLSGASNEASATPESGYLLVGRDGGVFAFGGASFEGSLGNVHLAAPIVGIAHTPDGGGYWLVGSDGGVFSFGDAHFYGSLGGVHLNAPIVGIAATPNGQGYWLVGADGGVFTFGDAGFHGSLGAVHLNAPIVGVASTPTGQGYWLVGSDGGVFTFGDAGFRGSLGNVHLNAPIVAMAAAPDGGGYRLVGSDGGVFDFGDAGFFGSLGGVHLAEPIVAITVTADDGGYWLVGSDGGIFAFGDAPYDGSVPATGASINDVIGAA